jgi:hypothetical protein
MMAKTNTNIANKNLGKIDAHLESLRSTLAYLNRQHRKGRLKEVFLISVFEKEIALVKAARRALLKIADPDVLARFIIEDDAVSFKPIAIDAKVFEIYRQNKLMSIGA